MKKRGFQVTICVHICTHFALAFTENIKSSSQPFTNQLNTTERRDPFGWNGIHQIVSICFIYEFNDVKRDGMNFCTCPCQYDKI